MSTDVKPIIYTKGMVKDLNESVVSDQVVTHARNAMLSTHKGDNNYYSNEPSTSLCYTLPYKFNGEVSLKNNRFFVCSSDNTNHEIGIVNLDTCEYTKLANNSCLNFNNNYIVTGIVKEDEYGNEIVLFNDGFNSTRIINLSNILNTYIISKDECKTKNFTNELDCDALLLFPKVTPPCLKVSKGTSGSLPNGVYEIGLAYAVENIRFSDVYSLTTPLHINNKQGNTSINIEISNLDLDFPQYQLYVVGTVDGVTTTKNVGTFSTSQSTNVLSTWNSAEYSIVSNVELTSTRRNYKSAGIIANNSQYAMLADLTRKEDINVQKYTNQIKLEYVVHQYDEDYYKTDGDNVGHYRNENYRYYLRYFWADGEPTLLGNIPGNKPKDRDLEKVFGDNVYESYTNINCYKQDVVYRWQVENTAGKLNMDVTPVNCGKRLGYGEFGYAESGEKYPDDKEVYGENACQPIRLHKYPDEKIVPRYTIDPSTKKRYINILGFRAKNIPHPVDEKGNKIKDIVGYEIVRSDRDGNNKTIVSRGLLSNMRGYTEKVGGEVLYSNYPYNDLSSDVFLSKTQVIKDNKGDEKGYEGLNTIYDNRLAFYGPHNYFFEKYKIGTELEIESEETATVTGNFVPVYKHPKHKLLTNFSLTIAALTGSLEAYLSFQGKTSTTTVAGTTQGTTNPLSNQTFVNVTDESGKTLMPIPTNLANAFIKVKLAISNAAKIVLNGLAFLGVAADFASKFLQQVRNFSSYKQYVYQYNSHALFTKQKFVKYRRSIVPETSRYIKSAPESINDYTINNFKKEEFIYLDIERAIPRMSSKDNSRRNVTQFGLCKDINKTVNSSASMFYGTIKIKNKNQYGTITNVNPIKTHSCIIDISNSTSPDLFGGDCIITRFTVNKKQPFFKENLAQSNFPDGTEFDYRLHRNIGFPRYYADFTEYDTGNLLNIVGNVIKSSSKDIEAALPDQKFNLDCKGNRGRRKGWVVENQYMYTSYNGVIDFFVECDYNIALRDNKNEGIGELYQSHYGSSSLENIFRSDNIDKEEGFSLDSSYRKITTKEIFAEQIVELNKSPLREKNTIIYSLPAFTGQKFNNWQYFLPNNKFNFDERDYGELTGIHAIDQDRVMFLFSKSSPFISLGRDQLETASGRKITIGDGGLFAQQPRESLPTDVYYGSSSDKYAFKSTQFGHFYVSRNQGKVFNFNNKFDEISRDGFHMWCRKYMPLQLLEAFPNYPHDDSPQTGLGYLLSFDNTYELIYICKRDYTVKEKYKQDIRYDEVLDRFTYKGIQITLGDAKYFNDASWTLSYSPGNKTFSSFHDWHPDWIIQQENHFASIKGNTIWKHNERCDNYCNFYGKDYPYEVEVTLSTGQNINLLRSFEFHNEVYINHNDCKDRYHVKNESFDQAEIYNTEQHSALLTLEFLNGRRPSEIIPIYPKVTPTGLIIVYSKSEQHYRMNMFHDMTKNRNANIPMWITQDNGYIRDVNPEYIDLNKPLKEKKAFRHYHNSILLRKTVSGANNFITKYQNFKITNSIL